ncbi:Y-family DNA polymerase [Halomonas sp. E19]|uniref:Y-family DNA polymerase n=1 Tax=Halomonas sp. E19 TaxID=3397247 RepID=UPI004033706A
MSALPAPHHAIGLVDCNSMYASAEIIFRPWLRDFPTVVLSSNDGNAIARNAAAKALGIPMGAPGMRSPRSIDGGSRGFQLQLRALPGHLRSRDGPARPAGGGHGAVLN